MRHTNALDRDFKWFECDAGTYYYITLSLGIDKIPYPFDI